MRKKSLEDVADQASHKAAAIRLLQELLHQQGEEPETATIAEILAGTKWTTGDPNRDKNYISFTLSKDRARGRPAGKPGRRPGSSAAPPPQELGLYRQFAEQEFQTLAMLNDILGKIDRIAAQLGGYERLKKCTAFWQEIESRPAESGQAKTPKKKGIRRSIDDDWQG